MANNRGVLGVIALRVIVLAGISPTFTVMSHHLTGGILLSNVVSEGPFLA